MRQRRRAERQQSARSASTQTTNRRLGERQRQRLLLAAIAVVLLALIGTLAVGWYLSEFRTPRKVVAEIDGVQHQLRDVFPYALLNSVTTGTFAQEQALTDLIGDGILDRHGADIGVTVGPAEVDADIVRQFEPASEDEEAEPPASLGEEGRDSFEEFLSLVRVDEEVYREWLAGRLRRDAGLEHFEAEAPATTEQVHVEWIAAATVTDARDAVARINEAGEEFAAVAAELNTDFIYAGEGGVVGWVPQGILPDDVDTLLFAEDVPHGELQGPHTTNLGALVFRITEGPSDQPLTGVMRTLWGQNDFQGWMEEQTAELQYDFNADDAAWLLGQVEGL